MDKEKAFLMEDDYGRNPYTGKIVRELKWWWRDENSEEPIGPFDTEEEAQKDYEEQSRGTKGENRRARHGESDFT